MDVSERDRRYMARGEHPAGVQVARSEGSFVVDHHGKKYIDFTSGWCVGNLGWANDEVREAIRAFNGPAYVHPDHLYRPWAELAETLAEITPGKLTKSYRATGGSEAVEIALQVAMAATGRAGFVCLEDCYHGNTLGGRSLAGDRDQYPNLLAHCHRIAPPLDDRAAERVERLLKGGQVAAFVMEPVVCNLGVVIPSKEFMTRVREACREHGTLFIMDEVATGFGRTWRLFASEHFDVDPDVLCLAKAITGGYAPMGATIVTDEVAKAAGVGFYSTYGWHPLSVAAALANLKYWSRHGDRILTNVAAQSDYFRARLTGMEFAEPASVRVIGLAVGVEFGEKKQLRLKTRRPVPGGRSTGQRGGGQPDDPVPAADHRPRGGAAGPGHPEDLPLSVVAGERSRPIRSTHRRPSASPEVPRPGLSSRKASPRGGTAGRTSART
ncbi:MAG TPA: aspartate aminotransferase family protein [Gemmataceae bacterium]|jgi:adenosylmethionine-8-amino-7-oxononanoate aminotransferase